MTLLIQTGNLGRAAFRVSRVFTIVVVPALTMYYLANAVSDTESVRFGVGRIPCNVELPELAAILPIVLGVLLTISLVPGVVTRLWGLSLADCKR